METVGEIPTQALSVPALVLTDNKELVFKEK